MQAVQGSLSATPHPQKQLLVHPSTHPPRPLLPTQEHAIASVSTTGTESRPQPADSQETAPVSVANHTAYLTQLEAALNLQLFHATSFPGPAMTKSTNWVLKTEMYAFTVQGSRSQTPRGLWGHSLRSL
jgi:hypothetical protein